MNLRYFLDRMLYSLLVLWGVVTLVFFLFNVLPADPARLTMGQRSDLASIENARHELNLDRPLLTRYFLYINDLLPISVNDRSPSAQQTYGYVRLLPVSATKSLVLKWPYLGRSYRTKRRVNEVLG